MSKEVKNTKSVKNSKNSASVKSTENNKSRNSSYTDEGEYVGKVYNYIDTLHGFLKHVAKKEETNKIKLVAGCTRPINAAKDGHSEAFDAIGALIKVDGEALFFMTYSSQVSDEEPSAQDLLKGSKDDYAVYERSEADTNDNPILVLGKPQAQEDFIESDDDVDFEF